MPENDLMISLMGTFPKCEEENSKRLSKEQGREADGP
jgi:hypothetical protein